MTLLLRPIDAPGRRGMTAKRWRGCQKKKWESA